MNVINKLIEEAKNKAGISSDYALAVAIGVKKQTVSRYKLGLSTPDIYGMRRLADLTGRTLDEVVALIEIEKETDEAKKEYWKNFYKRLGGVAASILVAVTLIMTPPFQNTDAFMVLASGQCILCKIMLLSLIMGIAALAANNSKNAVPRAGFAD